MNPVAIRLLAEWAPSTHARLDQDFRRAGAGGRHRWLVLGAIAAATRLRLGAATISALAGHGVPDRWIMTAGLFLVGFCHLVTAIGLPEAGPLGQAFLALGGAATMAVAMLPQPDPGHVVAAAIAFIALSLWPAFARVPELAIRMVTTVALLVLLAWFAVELHDGTQLGLSERILAAAQALCPLAVVLLLSRPRRPALGLARG